MHPASSWVRWIIGWHLLSTTSTNVPSQPRHALGSDMIATPTRRMEQPYHATELESSSRRACWRVQLMSLARYLELLDWTGRQLQHDEVGKIPAHLAPIFSHIGLDPLALV